MRTLWRCMAHELPDQGEAPAPAVLTPRNSLGKLSRPEQPHRRKRERDSHLCRADSSILFPADGCNKPVRLEGNTATDENGKAVHEHCQVKRVIGTQQRIIPPVLVKVELPSREFERSPDFRELCAYSSSVRCRIRCTNSLLAWLYPSRSLWNLFARSRFRTP